MDCHLCGTHHSDQDDGEVVWAVDTAGEPTQEWVCYDCYDDTTEECVACRRRCVSLEQAHLVVYCDPCNEWYCTDEECEQTHRDTHADRVANAEWPGTTMRDHYSPEAERSWYVY